MDFQTHRNLQEAYMEVYALDEKAVNWDTGKNASGFSPRDTAARRQAQLQSSSNPADKIRASQISNVRSNMRGAIKSTPLDQLQKFGPISSERFKNAIKRQIGGSPSSVPIKTVPGLKDVNKLAQTNRSMKLGGQSGSLQDFDSQSKTGVSTKIPGVKTYRVGGGEGYGLANIRLADHYDIYDIILSHLLDEGYAETPEAAEAIMVNMSEEWRESIVEDISIRSGISSGYSTKPGDNKPYKDGPLWDSDQKPEDVPVKKPNPPVKKPNPPMRAEPLF
jgi:hypothetical protein